jgi:hypothetical protein
MHGTGDYFESRRGPVMDVIESRHADNEVEVAAAERIKSGAAEQTQDGAEALREIGIPVGWASELYEDHRTS